MCISWQVEAAPARAAQLAAFKNPAQRTSPDLCALTQPGMPCTPAEFTARFSTFLAWQIRGKDPHKIRIQVDW